MATKPKSTRIDRKDLCTYAQVFTVRSAQLRAADVFRSRRDLQRSALSHPTFFSGIDREPGSENLWWMNGVRIIQEPALLWLTGINQAGVRLYIHPLDSSLDTLFLPTKKPEKEFWDGVRLGLYPADHPQAHANLDFLRNLTGFDRILPMDDFQHFLSSGFFGSTVGVFAHVYQESEWGPSRKGVKKIDSDHNAHFLKLMQKMGRKYHFSVSAIAKAHLDLRVILDKYQIKDAESATEVAQSAFAELLTNFSSSKDENALSRYLEFLMLRQNPWGLAFPTICAAGRNACTLHYLKNDEPLNPGELVLLDFGARYGTQHSDISRTLPISGQFNPLQALLYNIVLQAQKLNEQFLKPGVTLNEANERVWGFIEEELKSKFLATGGKMQRSYEFRPHGVSHLMGEQEHEGDPFRLYAREPLREGMLLSNEPGLYGHFEWTLEGRTYSEWIGIRIEDNLLITKNGCRNLSAGIPKEINDLEKLMNRKDHNA